MPGWLNEALPYVFLGGLPGLIVGLVIGGLCAGGKLEDAFRAGYAYGHMDGEGPVRPEGPVSMDGLADRVVWLDTRRSS